MYKKMMKTVFLAILLIVFVVGHNQDEGSSGRCKKDFFLCGDEANRCFSQDLVCDGVFDCQNGRDEMNCAEVRSKNDPFFDDVNLDIPTFNIEVGPQRDIPDFARNG